MTFLGLRGGRRVLAAAAAVLLAIVACSTPDYVFVDDEVLHCENNAIDAELGETDIDCGGPECRGCNYGQRCVAASDCAEGECLEGYCLEAGCENRELDGNETAVDCGGGCPGCREGQPCLVATDCESKVCTDGVCAAPTCDDGVRNGDELAADCGGSFCDGCGIGDPCNVAADCESRACDDSTSTCALNCARGTDECDGDTDEPCETNLLTSNRNCGECGKVCNLAHAEASCIGGTCQIEDCVDPWIRCNTDDADGCEVNSSTDEKNCGACGRVCPGLNGDASCVNGECVIDCEIGFGNCDRDALTGCEAPVNDVDNCGECGRKCPAGAGTPYCVEDEDDPTGYGCGITVCEMDGYGDCDGDKFCETNLQDDPENCGRCGGACSSPNGRAECVEGKCVIVECDDGWLSCDEDAPDGGVATGCETNVERDVRNCGACGVRCDAVANGTGTCEDGVCKLACASPFRDCDNRIENGCETDTTSDPDHCGGCRNECDVPNARAACVDSECTVDECLGDYDDCNSAAGCETDTSDSVQHCGGCGRACSRAGATSVACDDGACAAPSCDAEHRNCDGNNANGCETDVTTADACGDCNTQCEGATPHCVRSGSTYRCQARVAIANALPYPTAQVAGNRLTFNATPHAGTNRLFFLAIASESQNNGFAGARPDSVRFGNQTMTAGPSQAGTNDSWSPDLFVYYLPLGDAAAAETQVTVTIDATVDPTAHGIIAQGLLLTGARQTNPISASAGAFVGNPEAPDPSVSELMLPLAASGSAIYSFSSALWIDGGNCPAGTPSSNCPSWSVSPSANLTATETMSTSPISVFGTPMRAFGMFVNASSPSLPAAGTYAPRWSIPWTGRMTHLAVAIAPAQQP